MKNICQTIDDFLENLRIELQTYQRRWEQWESIESRPVGSKKPVFPLHRESVFLSKYDEPIGEDKRNAVKFNVLIHVTAVVATEEGEYLLECTENMGIDYRDSSDERSGSVAADLAVAKIKEFCETNGLMIRPGSVTY